jgi:hypothetical protein
MVMERIKNPSPALLKGEGEERIAGLTQLSRYISGLVTPLFWRGAGGEVLTGFILCAVLFFSSCTPKIFSSLESVGKKKNISKEELYPIFKSTDSTRMFNMEITYKENSFNGLLVVKPNEDGSRHVVFTTLFGMTIFDFEISESEFKVNRCMEQMQKKMVLNLLKKDFRTLFLYNVPETFDAKVYQGDASVPQVAGYSIKTADGKGYFVTVSSQKQLQKVETPGCITRLLLDSKNTIPQQIQLFHPKIKLKMQLEELVNEE